VVFGGRVDFGGTGVVVVGGSAGVVVGGGSAGVVVVGGSAGVVVVGGSAGVVVVGGSAGVVVVGGSGGVVVVSAWAADGSRSVTTAGTAKPAAAMRRMKVLRSRLNLPVSSSGDPSRTAPSLSRRTRATVPRTPRPDKRPGPTRVTRRERPLPEVH
jgi:hypothetical protein